MTQYEKDVQEISQLARELELLVKKYFEETSKIEVEPFEVVRGGEVVDTGTRLRVNKAKLKRARMNLSEALVEFEKKLNAL